MVQYIDWMLFSDKKLLLCKKNEQAKYEINKDLIYETDKEYNKIDLEKKLFIRKTDELYMELNFIEKTCKFDFENEGSCKFDIECGWEEQIDEITLTYNLDDSEKNVKIIFKKLVI
ncbi:MAG: hypothetical protein R3Y13_03540 [bacterium]